MSMNDDIKNILVSEEALKAKVAELGAQISRDYEGRNLVPVSYTHLVYECNGDMIIVDCGLVFPDSEMYGVDMVIPDFTFVVQNKDKIKGCLLYTSRCV